MRQSVSSTALPAAISLSARVSSLLNSPALSLPSATMMAPVSVARSTMNRGLKRSWVYHSASASSRDRKSVVEGKSVAVRVDLGGRRIIKKKNTDKTRIEYEV